MTERLDTTPARPFDNAAALQEANTRLLQALNAQLAGHPDIEDRNHALRALRPQVLEFLQRCAATGARLEEQRQRSAAQVQLDYWASLLEHAGVPADVDAIADFDAGALPELPDSACPYAGLQAVGGDTPLIGRDAAVASLRERLATTRLVVVQGGSGSGKSSLVLAGAAPAWLARAPAGARLVGPLQPGSDTLHALAAGLQPAAAAPAEPPRLLVIDAFERVFTGGSKDDGPALAAALAALLEHRPDDRVVLVVREEFSRRLDELQPLAPLLAAHARFSMREWPMGFQELKACVEEPAARINLQFQPGLVDDLVRGVLQRDSALLLLQFALRELWARRDRNRITWERYRELGGDPVAIVERFADRAVALLLEDFPPRQREAAQAELQAIWAELIGVDHLFNAYRLTLPWRDLAAAGSSLRAPVLAAMVRVGLLLRHGAGDDPPASVEIHDEALLQYWADSQAVAARRRGSARRRVALTEAAQRWDRAGRPARLGLLTDWQLHELQDLPEPSDLERAYLERSRAAIQRSSALRRLRYLLAGVAFTGLVALALFAELRQRDAERLGLSRQIRTAAAALQEGHLGPGLEQVIQAAGQIPADSADESLRHEALAALIATHRQTSDVELLFTEQAAVFRAVAFQPGDTPQRLFAYGGTGGLVHLVQLDPARPRASLPACSAPEAAGAAGIAGSVTALAFDPRGTRLAASCADGRLTLWSVADGQPVGTPIRLSHQPLRALAFAPTGDWLAAAGQDDLVHVLATPDGDAPGVAQALGGDGEQAPLGGIWSLAIDPSDTSILVGDGRGRLLRCDPRLAAGQACADTRLYPASSADALRAIVISATGRRVAVGHWKGTVELWDSPLGPARSQAIDVGHTPGPVLSLAFHGACHLAVGKPLSLHYRTIGLEWAGPPSADECPDLLESSLGDETYALASDAATGRVAAATRGYVALIDPRRRFSRLHADLPVDSPPGQQVRGTLLHAAPPGATLGVALQQAQGSSALQVVELQQDSSLGPRIAAAASMPTGPGGLLRVAASRAGERLALLAYDGATDGTPRRVVVRPLGPAAGAPLGPPLLTLTQAGDFLGYQPARVVPSPDGRWLAVPFNAQASRLHLTPRERGEALWALVDVDARSFRWMHSGLASVREMTFSADGRLLAAGGDALAGDGRDELRLWAVTRSGIVPLERPPMRLSPFARRVQELAFAEGATPPWPTRWWRGPEAMLLAGGENGELDAWEVASGAPQRPTWLATSDLWLLAFEPHSGLLAASDQRHVLRLWVPRDPDTHPIVLSSPAETLELPGWLAFGADGQWLASAARQGAAGALLVWDLDVDSLRRKACGMLRRPGERGAASDARDPCADHRP